MRLIPRKHEVQAVVDILVNDDGSRGDDEIAKEIIKRVGELFTERTWYGMGVRLGDSTIIWGPLSSPAEVKKLAERAGIEDTTGVIIFSTAALEARITEGERGALTHCGGCQHPIGLHEHPKWNGRCAANGCGCPEVRIT